MHPHPLLLFNKLTSSLYVASSAVVMLGGLLLAPSLSSREVQSPPHPWLRCLRDARAQAFRCRLQTGVQHLLHYAALWCFYYC